MSSESSPPKDGVSQPQGDNGTTPSDSQSVDQESEQVVAEKGTRPSSEPTTQVSEKSSPDVPQGNEPPAIARDSSPEIIELEPESIKPPPPPSLRPRTAKDATGAPMGVTSNLPKAVWPPKTVADVMTRKIITVQEDEPIGNLEAHMQRFRFRHLPVVKAGMKLVGLISLTDLLHAKLGTAPDGSAAPKVEADTPARAIMRKNVVIARVDSPLAAACEVLLDKKLTCLPVVLEDGTLVGMFTQTDALTLTLRMLKEK